MHYTLTELAPQIKRAFDALGRDVRGGVYTTNRPGVYKMVKLAKQYLEQSQIIYSYNTDEDEETFEELEDTLPMVAHYYKTEGYPTESMRHLVGLLTELIKDWKYYRKQDVQEFLDRLKQLPEDTSPVKSPHDVDVKTKRTKEEKATIIQQVASNYKTKQEFADTYGIPVRTISDWINKGTAPDYVINMLLMIEGAKEEDDSWLDEPFDDEDELRWIE